MFSESEIKIDLKRSTVLRTWGRDVIFAIDMDNPVRMIDIFQHKYHNEPFVDEQTTRWGYAGYTWTVRIQDFLGDTALNISIKQKKIKCIYALLLLKANTTIRNYAGEDANNLSLRVLGHSIKELTSDAMTGLLPLIDPRKFKILPDQLEYRGIEQEAWRLMRQGMCLYSDKPKGYPERYSLKHSDESDDETDRHQSRTVVPRRDTNVSSFAFSDNTDLHPRDDKLAFRSESLTGVLELLRTQRLRWRGQYRRDLLHQSGLSLLEQVGGPEQGNEDDFNLFSEAGAATGGQRRLFGLDNLTFLKPTAGRLGSPGKRRVSGSLTLPGQTEEPNRHAVVSDLYRNITEISTKSNLKYDSIGDHGAQLLAAALKDDHVIECLVLSSARIGDLGAEAIGSAVQSMKCLRHLDLSQNCIGDLGAVYIARAISSAAALELLSVEGNRIGAAAVAQLINAAADCAFLDPPHKIASVNVSSQYSCPPAHTKGVCRILSNSVASAAERQGVIDQLLNRTEMDTSVWEVSTPVTDSAVAACLKLKKKDGTYLTVRL